MGDSRTEMEGYRFWKTGYWKDVLRGKPYHISALYLVDLDRFRKLAAGDRLRGQYQALSADPGSLANLDQDLPNVMQSQLPIFSLDPSWLWCETWCSDESLKTAKTIDLCNNPMTHEPKLARAKRLLPEWTEYDQEVAELAKILQMRAAKAQAQAQAEAGSSTASGTNGLKVEADTGFGAIAVEVGELEQAVQQEQERKEFVGSSKASEEGSDRVSSGEEEEEQRKRDEL